MAEAKTGIIGVEERYYPDMNCPDDPPVTCAVLVLDVMGHYKCYVGHGSPGWVRSMGNKISFEEAKALFPHQAFTKENYRR